MELTLQSTTARYVSPTKPATLVLPCREDMPLTSQPSIPPIPYPTRPAMRLPSPEMLPIPYTVQFFGSP